MVGEFLQKCKTSFFFAIQIDTEITFSKRMVRKAFSKIKRKTIFESH